MVFFSVCRPVGVEDRNKLPDARITASTFDSVYYYPHYGRFNENRGYGAWCTKTRTDRTDYLQVDMGAVHSVCAVATQGEKKDKYSTTSYKVHLSTDGLTWKSYKENNVEKVTKIIYSCLGIEAYRVIIILSKQDNFVVCKPPIKKLHYRQVKFVSCQQDISALRRITNGFTVIQCI